MDWNASDRLGSVRASIQPNCCRRLCRVFGISIFTIMFSAALCPVCLVLKSLDVVRRHLNCSRLLPRHKCFVVFGPFFFFFWILFYFTHLGSGQRAKVKVRVIQLINCHLESVKHTRLNGMLVKCLGRRFCCFCCCCVTADDETINYRPPACHAPSGKSMLTRHAPREIGTCQVERENLLKSCIRKLKGKQCVFEQEFCRT